MRNCKAVVLTLLGAFALLYVSSASATQAWTGLGKVTQVYAFQGALMVKTDITTGLVCAGSVQGQYFWVTDPLQFAAHKDLYALALSAMLMGKSVQFLVDDTSCFSTLATGAVAGVVHN